MNYAKPLATGTPPKAGRYLVLVYEWLGLGIDKPKEPHWEIKFFDGKKWERQQYWNDTGGMENDGSQRPE